MSGVTWDPVWDKLHGSGRMPDDTWPTDDMIRQVARRYYRVPDRRAVRALDLGCGSGAMTWFLARAGFRTAALDGSDAAVAACRRRLEREGLPAEVVRGDIVALPWPDAAFDFCVESQCLMCCPPEVARTALAEVWRVLKPGGALFSRTPTTECWGSALGEPCGEDCRRDAADGPYQGMGFARFVRRQNIPALYAPFSVAAVERSLATVDNMAQAIDMWVITCVKEAT